MPSILKRPRTIVLGLLLVLTVALLSLGKVGPVVAALGIGLPLYVVFLLVRKLLRRSHLIWRLRNRLLVTYFFVGAVPILLILGLAFCGAWIVVGQVATYLVSSELSRKAAALTSPAKFMSEVPAEQRVMLAAQLGPVLKARNPQFEIFVSGDSHFPSPPSGWSDFTGVVKKQGAFYVMALVTHGDTRAAIVAPLTSEVLASLVPGIGSINIATSSSFAGIVPPAWNLFDVEMAWGNPFEYTDWNNPGHETNAYVAVITRPSAVLAVVFGDRVGFAQGILILFLFIAATLALVEVLSVFLTWSMTRTVTGAVHNLYEGTRRIGEGDFTHRIPAAGNDQLGELSHSFNQMTEQLGRLVLVAKEKERLQSELTIASEVQNQLFPRVPPPMATIKLLGACEPARSVSGDYYDYLCLPDGNLAIAIGDVAGKGISAALLMAAIQSIMRSQLASGTPSPSRIVSQLSKQLFENTSPEKYATFFFGLYDERSRALTYTNAGHLPPLLVCGETVQPLDVTGTVVGMFAKSTYEEQSIILHPGDLLIAYTDGISEPENAYGEEYGTDRLSDLVLRNRTCEPIEIVAKVMEAVKHWSHSDELPDDMTVLIAQGIA